MIKQCLSIVILGTLAAGCTTRGQVEPDVMQIATAPLTCTSDTQCTLWWQRAKTWVTDHSRYPLQTASDSLIQTTGPDGGKRALAYQITKAPNNDGTSTIGFAAHCDSALGCKPDPWRAGADFKQFVRNGVAATPDNTSDSASTPQDASEVHAMPAQSVRSETGEPPSQ